MEDLPDAPPLLQMQWLWHWQAAWQLQKPDQVQEWQLLLQARCQRR